MYNIENIACAKYRGLVIGLVIGARFIDAFLAKDVSRGVRVIEEEEAGEASADGGGEYFHDSVIK